MMINLRFNQLRLNYLNNQNKSNNTNNNKKKNRKIPPKIRNNFH